MPKAKSKSKKNKKSLLSRINFKSRKVQFITTILIIAIAGGGYFTYKSFAATLNYVFVDCSPANCLNASLIGQTAFRESDPQKNNMPYFRLTKSGKVSTSLLTIPGDATMQYCATVKADRAVVLDASIGFTNKGGAWKINANTNWADVCSGFQGPFGNSMPGATLSVQNNTTANVYVSKIFIRSDKQTAPKTPK